MYARPASRYVLLVMAAVLASLLAIALLAWSLSNRLLLPELERKAQAVAQSAAAEMAGPLAMGRSLDGVAPYFEGIQRDNPELAFIVLTAPDGKVLRRSGHVGEAIAPERYMRRSSDVMHRYASYGKIEVGIDRGYLATRSGQLPWLLAVLAAATLIVTLEFLRCGVSLHVAAPMRQAFELIRRMAGGDFRYRAVGDAPPAVVQGLNTLGDAINRAFCELARLAATPHRRALAEPVVRRLRSGYRFDEHGIRRQLPVRRAVAVRLLAFIPAFAEALALPLMPAWSAAMHAPALPAPLRATLPVAAFMLGAAMLLPFARRWSDHAGRRNVYIIGSMLMAAALAGTAYAAGYADVLAGRLLCGAGFMLACASCAGHIADSCGADDRNVAMLSLPGAMFMAWLCAPGIGALAAMQVSVQGVFGAAAVTALGAALMSFGLIDNANARFRAHVLPPLRGMARPDPRLWLVTVCGIAPCAFAGFAFPALLAPIAFAGEGHGVFRAGLSVSAYAVPVVVLAPLVARLAARFNAHAAMACTGGALSAAALLSVRATPDLVAALALLGAGHALALPPLVALATRYGKQGAGKGGCPLPLAAAGLLAGGALGAAVAGAVGALGGVENALLCSGLLVAGAAAALALSFARYAKSQRRAANPGA